MKYLISKFYDQKTLQTIRKELCKSSWQSGLLSIDFPNDFNKANKTVIKKNLETAIPTEVLLNPIDKCNSFLDFTIPKSSTDPIISKMMKGGFYKPHLDNAHSGHFSTTIFLVDPEKYSGGELCLFVNEKEEKFKLNAGYGITYETGIPHSVNPVTEGERIVCVFWTKTRIPVMEDLYKYRYYINMADRYHDVNFIAQSCEEFYYNLDMHFTGKANKILRKWI